MVPFITKLGLFTWYKNKIMIDGGVTSAIPYKYENSQKVFINVLPKFTRKWPIVWKQPKNCINLDISEGQDISFPVDYWLWNEEWADE